MKAYPTRFECVEGEELLFKVEAFDCCAAKVEIKSLVNVAMWDEMSALIRECLVKMERGDK